MKKNALRYMKQDFTNKKIKPIDFEHWPDYVSGEQRRCMLYA